MPDLLLETLSSVYSGGSNTGTTLFRRALDLGINVLQSLCSWK
jgi:hypothetical protein